MDVSNVSPPEYDMYEEIIRLKINDDMTSFSPNEKNLQTLKTLQKVILYEEARVQSLDEVLTRVLEWYNRYVQFI